ncbi:MAG: LOG family protein [Candidatus Daviesbacteria bacterium]|nr:LOG family protein [Candidatus Daviesbacteria bacterium]
MGSHQMSNGIPKAESINQIAIFGSSHTEENSVLCKETFTVCKKLTEAGYVVVDGGGPGVMRAASLGAKAGGGKVIGVTFQAEEIMHFEGRDFLNKIDVEIKTKNYLERTLTLLKEGQVYVIFNGGTGTISEFGMAWGLAKLYFGHHKPLILYGKFWENIIKAFKDNMILRPEELEVYKIVDNPDAVLQAILDFEHELKQGQHLYVKAITDDFSV